MRRNATPACAECNAEAVPPPQTQGGVPVATSCPASIHCAAGDLLRGDMLWSVLRVLVPEHHGGGRRRRRRARMQRGRHAYAGGMRATWMAATSVMHVCACVTSAAGRGLAATSRTWAMLTPWFVCPPPNTYVLTPLPLPGLELLDAHGSPILHTSQVSPQRARGAGSRCLGIAYAAPGG